MTPFIGPPWFRDISTGYLAHLHRKGRRPNTLTAYRFELQAFARWLELESIADAEQLTGRRLEDFQDWRAGQVVAKTQQVSASAVRGALRSAASQEPPLCSPALCFRLTTPRTGRLLPRPIPRADLEKLLAALGPRPERRTEATIPGPAGPELEHLLRLRSRALFLLILSSGARISEALSLDRDQLQNGTAVVIQKGGSEKLLVVSAAAEEAVADYVAARHDNCRAMFIGHGPQQAGSPKRLDKSSQQLVWDDLCGWLGVARFTAHQVRHTCATELLRQGVDSLVIAKHLGHRGLQAIAGYAEVGLATRQSMLEVLDQRIRRAS